MRFLGGLMWTRPLQQSAYVYRSAPLVGRGNSAAVHLLVIAGRLMVISEWDSFNSNHLVSMQVDYVLLVCTGTHISYARYSAAQT